MYKKTKIGVLMISSFATISAAFLVTNSYGVVNAINNEVWYHYSAVTPMENRHGSKEFWASSSNNCKTFVLEKPTEGQIVDKDFSSNPFFEELTFVDERYIPSNYEERNAIYPLASGGGYYKYGIYPDVVVDDLKLINILDKLEDSAIDTRNGWYLYDGSYYTNIDTNPTAGAKYHNGNPIPKNTTNWFKCNPITWRELSGNSGDKFLLADDLLDVFQYHASSSVYLNSNIRNLLNNDFYYLAFALGNAYIKPTLINDNILPEQATSTDFDHVFLPSYQNYTNPDFGFDQDYSHADPKRLGRTTDYTRARGANLSSDGGYFGRYFTRTPSITVPADHVYQINDEGQIYGYTVDDNNAGVRPAITINFAIN